MYATAVGSSRPLASTRVMINMDDFQDQGEEGEQTFRVSEQRDAKVRMIRACLKKDVIDLWELRELSLTSGGLVNAEMRQHAWPLLVGLRLSVARHPTESTKGAHTIDEKDVELIRRDAGRSVLYRYQKRGSAPSPQSVTELVLAGEEFSPKSVKSIQQERLASVLEATIASPLSRQQGKIHYYQGLHDVAGVMLLNLEDVNLTSSVMRRICQTHFRDALRQDFHQMAWFLDRILLPLIDRVDQDVHDFLVDAEVEMSNGMLPWIVTWFSHDIHKEEVASRLLDAFLCSHPMFPLYFAVALLTHPYNKQELICSDPDPAMAYMMMRTFPAKIQPDWDSDSGITAQDLLDYAFHMMREVPPRSLLKLSANYHKAIPTEETIEKSCSLSIMKAPPSWALASTAVSVTAEIEEGDIDTEKSINGQNNRATIIKQRSSSPTNRAKIASGVEVIMKTVPFDTTFSLRATQGETHQEFCPKAFHARSHWTVYKLMMFGRRSRVPR